MHSDHIESYASCEIGTHDVHNMRETMYGRVLHWSACWHVVFPEEGLARPMRTPTLLEQTHKHTKMARLNG